MIKTQMEMYLHEELETLTRTEIEALAPYGPSLYEISFLSETVCRGSFVS